MGVQIVGTGVTIRPATAAEEHALEQLRRGRAFAPEPTCSYRVTEPERRLGVDEAYVVSQAFVDFTADGRQQRWVGAEHHGESISLGTSATEDLLRLANETAEEGLIGLLGDMGIEGLRVSRWQLFSASRRIDLAPELETRLPSLRRR
jgi:hypothetical protein